MAWCACVVGVALVFLLPARAAGQEFVTLDRAVSAALTRNASLRAARAGADEAAARVTEARSGLFPRFSVTESWQRGDQPVFVFGALLSSRQFAATNFAIDALNHPDPIGFFRTSVGVDQLLFDGGRQRAAATAASLRSDIAKASRDEATAAVAVATTQAFARLVAAQAARRAADAALTAVREDLAQTERRRDAGMANDADVLSLVVHVAELRQRAIQADGDAGIAAAELNRLMGDAVDRELVAVEPSTSSPEVVDRREVAGLLAEADAARPELKRAAASARTAEAAQRQARAAMIPQVAAQAVFDLSGTRFVDRASSWIVGGEFRWTFSAGGAELASLKGAAAGSARTHAEADDLRAAVHVEVVSAWHRVESARARETVARAAVDQARESQRILRDRFAAGIAPVNDVLRASASVLEAEASSIAALTDAIVANAMLRRALGRTP